MHHLSGIDAAFLYVETPEMPMHVGSLNLLDLPAGYSGDFWDDLKTHVQGRMHLAPLFTRKLALMPFELANPVWVDDDDIDLDYHIRRVVLPKPGTMAQLEALVGRLHSSLLDRSRPLWEFYLIEGLAAPVAQDSSHETPGQHVAFYSKAHHAAMDGAAGAVLANAILDASATPRVVKTPPARRAQHAYQLGMAELAGAALKNAALQYLKLAKSLPTLARVAGRLVLPAKGADGKRGARLPKGSGLGPRTPFNVSITNQRLFAGRSLPLADAKRIAKLQGVTLNDVVMALCSAALRRYLDERNSLPAKSLVAGVPVSLREVGNAEMNNQAMAMLVRLATDVADPLARLQAIHTSAVAAKQFTSSIKAAVPMDFPSFGTPWLMTGIVSLIGRSGLATALPPISNVVISNVPGPQTPLYLAGARMRSNFPVSIPAHGMALNITVQSYNGALDFGLTACRRAVPDVRDIADHLGDALVELLAAATAQAGQAATAAPTAHAALAPPQAVLASAKPRRKPATPARSLAQASPPAAADPSAAGPSATKPSRASRPARPRLVG